MNKHLIPSLIISVSILAGFSLLGQALKQPEGGSDEGKYAIIANGNGAAYKLNTITGEVFIVLPTQQRLVPFKEKVSP